MCIKNNELISVIIPTYKNHDTIEHAINSIISQTYTDIELIIVDDNLPEEQMTKDIILDYACKDRRIKYFKNISSKKKYDHRGTNIDAGYSARNYGISRASGGWITFQDGDDISLKNRLELQYLLVKKYGVSHITTDCVWLKDGYLGKSLQFEKFIKDYPLGDYSIGPDEISKEAESSLTLITKYLPDFLFNSLTYYIKRKRYINRLFYKYEPGYPGAANNPFVKAELAVKTGFRHVDQRKWPSYRGRGADRDFNFNIAYTYRNSLSFKLPLYCWRTPKSFTKDYNIDNYLE